MESCDTKKNSIVSFNALHYNHPFLSFVHHPKHNTCSQKLLDGSLHRRKPSPHDLRRSHRRSHRTRSRQIPQRIPRSSPGSRTHPSRQRCVCVESGRQESTASTTGRADCEVAGRRGESGGYAERSRSAAGSTAAASGIVGGGGVVCRVATTTPIGYVDGRVRSGTETRGRIQRPSSPSGPRTSRLAAQGTRGPASVHSRRIGQDDEYAAGGGDTVSEPGCQVVSHYDGVLREDTGGEIEVESGWRGDASWWILLGEGYDGCVHAS
mmetsp:Transcript_6818/g.11101  ORF Transcript_6818/g.11101 Transcript_6818/m.11101 type:complete len:266 (+) Transcript_6818:285-1082(+)